MLIFVLNRVEKLEPALNKLEHAGLRGATVLSSRGMAMTLDKYCDGSFLGSLRAMMEPDREENRTVFMVLKDEMWSVPLPPWKRWRAASIPPTAASRLRCRWIL